MFVQIHFSCYENIIIWCLFRDDYVFEFIVHVHIATVPPCAKCISMVFMDNKVSIIIIIMIIWCIFF